MTTAPRDPDTTCLLPWLLGQRAGLVARLQGLLSLLLNNRVRALATVGEREKKKRGAPGKKKKKKKVEHIVPRWPFKKCFKCCVRAQTCAA